MFEGLVESRGMAISSTQRWTALGSLTFQMAVGGLLIAIPLMRPQILSPISLTPRLELPLPMKPPIPAAQTRATSGSAAQPALPATMTEVSATQRFEFHRLGDSDAGPVPTFDPTLPIGMGGPGKGIGVLSTIPAGSGPAVVVRPEKKAGPLPVSGGVTEGMLLAPIQPVYPPIAKATGTQGAVVMEAVISKAGRIESLHVVSGPALLQRAAEDAALAARYRPYLLSGVPTEVQTTITVVFRMGS